jgi:hypothetical protein
VAPQQPPPRSSRRRRTPERCTQAARPEAFGPLLETYIPDDLCLQSAVTAILLCCSGARSASGCPCRPFPKVCARVPLPHRCPIITSKPELARRSRAFLLSTGVSSGAHPAWGEEEAKKPPSLRSATSPSGAQAQPRSAGGKAPPAQTSTTKPPARLLACVNAAVGITSPFSRTVPAQLPSIRSPALSLSIARTAARACTVRSCFCLHRRESARPCSRNMFLNAVANANADADADAASQVLQTPPQPCRRRSILFAVATCTKVCCVSACRACVKLRACDMWCLCFMN